MDGRVDSSYQDRLCLLHESFLLMASDTWQTSMQGARVKNAASEIQRAGERGYREQVSESQTWPGEFEQPTLLECQTQEAEQLGRWSGAQGSQAGPPGLDRRLFAPCRVQHVVLSAGYKYHHWLQRGCLRSTTGRYLWLVGSTCAHEINTMTKELYRFNF